MSARELPSLPDGFEYRLDLRHHVTPRLLKQQPVHRWFWFPHSFSPQLIDEILKIHPLPDNGRMLDPFVGAGTTVVRARQLGYAAIGTDLSPLSLFVSQVKLTPLEKQILQEHLRFVLDYAPAEEWGPLPERLQKAFTRGELSHLIGLQRRIDMLPQPSADFFRLALLRVQQRVSRAVPDGGWFRWVHKKDQSETISNLLHQQASMQIADVEQMMAGEVPAQVLQDDARRLDKVREKCDLVITSPPYPNRHDYSRIFHIELLSLGLREQAIKRLRYESIRSHVEAKPPEIQSTGYTTPPALEEVLKRLPDNADARIEPLLRGYFEDMYLVLEAVGNHVKTGAVCVFVVGNVRHAGVMVPVDEILGQVGAQAGYSFENAWVARLRGNSAQQMGRFGREAARESIVFLRKC